MMKITFKHLLVVSVILTLFLGLNLVSATDVTDDNAVSTKNICTHSITSDNNDNIDVVMRILIMVILSVLPMAVLSHI